MRTEEEIRKQKDAMHDCLERRDVDYDYAMGYIAALEFALGEE
jgi:hypothetical protein